MGKKKKSFQKMNRAIFQLRPLSRIAVHRINPQAVYQWENHFGRVDQMFKELERVAFPLERRMSGNMERAEQYATGRVEDGQWVAQLKLNENEQKTVKIKRRENVVEVSAEKVSEVKEKGFQEHSTHKWCREIQVPKSVKLDSLEAQMDENGRLLFKGQLENSFRNIQIQT